MENPGTILFLAVLISAAAGAFLSWQLALRRLRAVGREKEQSGREEAAARERAQLLEQELERVNTHAEALRASNTELQTSLSEEKVRRESDLKRMEEYREEVRTINEKMSKEFELISHRLMEKNAESFANLSKQNVDNLLSPFGEKLKSFEDIVRNTYEKEMKERVSLMEEVRRLHETNLRLGEDAQNLTRALKGDSKTRGNWGELVLERVLERSGLRKGEEYTTQLSLRGEENDRYQPDVIIHLPDDKHLVIDAKVSLVAYEHYLSEDDEVERELWLKRHVAAVKQHVKDLSGKSYQHLEGIDTPEFVMMFIPIESSFSLTIQADADLFQDAWQSRIVIVSPTTLLATLRTVASIWQHEKQTRNAILIAKEGGALIDKLTATFAAVKRLGNQIGTVMTTQQDIVTKMDGRGGLISRAMKLQELGARAKRQLPTGSQSEEEDADMETENDEESGS